MKKLLIEMKTMILLEYADEYSDTDHVEFHLNDSCHCAGNEYQYLALARPDNKLFVALAKTTDEGVIIGDGKEVPVCGCLQTEFKVVREATEEDIKNEIAIDLSGH